MGQYYRPIIIDCKGDTQVLSSYEFSNGAKIMEHSWTGNEFVNAVLSLIHNNRACVAWIGDYSDEPYEYSEDIYTHILTYEQFIGYYKTTWGESIPVTPINFTKDDLDIFNMETKGMYLLNHDRLEYIDPGAYIQDNSAVRYDYSCCINPLPLLTACGNGRGGGDFYEGNTGYENVGLWAFAVLEYTATAPNNYTERRFKFIEN